MVCLGKYFLVQVSDCEVYQICRSSQSQSLCQICHHWVNPQCHWMTSVVTGNTPLPSKQPIRTRYLGHVTGYQPIRDQYFHIRSVAAPTSAVSGLRTPSTMSVPSSDPVSVPPSWFLSVDRCSLIIAVSWEMNTALFSVFRCPSETCEKVIYSVDRYTVDRVRNRKVNNQPELVIYIMWLVISQSGTSISWFSWFLDWLRGDGIGSYNK